MKLIKPFVSILVAARNEEENITDCINALICQSYSIDMFEIIIGNDLSKDNTKSLVENLKINYKNIILLDIITELNGLKAKANVLAHLARIAKGDIFLITDADVIVNRNWVRSMISEMQKGFDMITGVTGVMGNTLFAKIQDADWIFYTGLGHDFAQRGTPVTAMGNNMAISKLAYDSVGGYENIPFSITEDYELFKAVTKQGFSFNTTFDTQTLAFTKPITSIWVYFNQRKRWLTGGYKLPNRFKIGLFFQALFLPALIFLSYFFNNDIALGIIFFLLWAQNIVQLLFYYNKLSYQNIIGTLLCFPFQIIFNSLFLIFQILPVKVIWKGRIY